MQIVVSDGLSAEAVHHNVPDLLPVLLDGLGARGVTVGQPLLARYGRVKLAEAVAERLGARLVVMLLAAEAGGVLVEKVVQVLARRAAGNRLEALLAGGAT